MYTQWHPFWNCTCESFPSLWSRTPSTMISFPAPNCSARRRKRWVCYLNHLVLCNLICRQSELLLDCFVSHSAVFGNCSGPFHIFTLCTPKHLSRWVWKCSAKPFPLLSMHLAFTWHGEPLPCGPKPNFLSHWVGDDLQHYLPHWLIQDKLRTYIWVTPTFANPCRQCAPWLGFVLACPSA